jgi:hypothetical protein
LTRAVLSLGVLSGVTACGANASAGPQSLPALHPSAGASAGLSARPAPTRGTTPTDNRKTELAAATAVVRRYYAIANDLPRNMDANALAALFTSGCPCQAQARAIRQAAARDEHYVDQSQFNALRPSLDEPGYADVLVDLNVSRGGLSTARGQRVTSVPPANHVLRVFRLKRDAGSWLIFRIDAA